MRGIGGCKSCVAMGLGDAAETMMVGMMTMRAVVEGCKEGGGVRREKRDVSREAVRSGGGGVCERLERSGRGWRDAGMWVVGRDSPRCWSYSK